MCKWAKWPGTLCLAAVAWAQPSAESVEFFEKEIRPLLAAQCYSCHSAAAKPVFAGLRLDSRAGVLKGSDSGAVIVAGHPEQSKLIRAVKGELPARMPPTGKLSEGQIAALEKWIRLGSPWPEERAEAAAAGQFNLEQRRSEHWAWQPVRKPDAPVVKDTAWPLQPIDRFLLAKLEEKGLRPAEPAMPRTLVRRVHFDLTGLPPAPEDLDVTYEQTIDRLLNSPRFGEHWARHWMDLIRYAESHGSEGDPDTPEAWRYRDYLIRALNNDVPYDQLVREHLAGDLLPNPRINPELRINESLIGVANLRMVEHGFQPVDPWEDRVKWADNQIDVFSKTFQGLTISCARCHDHKFDAISQQDFHALFTTFAGARPTQSAIDLPDHLERHSLAMTRLKKRIRSGLAEAWLEQAKAWDSKTIAALSSLKNPRDTFNQEGLTLAWNLTNPDHYRLWKGHGTGLPTAPSPPGEFSISSSPDRVIGGIYPAGVYSHLLTPKHNAVLTSPRFKIERDAISLRLLGGNFSFAQLIIENYAVPRGGIYHLRFSPKQDRMHWATWDTTFWKGFTAYIEFATLDDATHFILDEDDGKKKPRPEPVRDGRSWFGAHSVWFHDKNYKPKEETISILNSQELAIAAIESFRNERMSNAQAAYLDALLQSGLLSANPETTREIAAEYRRLEAEVPVARRAPSVLEECAAPQPLLVRGNHKNPGAPVAARYLTALDSPAYPDSCFTRLHLADAVARASNPLTARVFVNRVWHHLFGRGLVATVDNFGKLGEPPTHPELLDYLAARFVEEGWSIKRLIRMMVSSRAYRMSSGPSPSALLSHMPVRRLEAEAIRDSILAVAGTLDLTMYGESVPVFYAHDTGKTKGDKPKGPIDGMCRRSIYLEIRRNATNPFLEVFDFPVPSSTRGQRDITNVPAQSLALMNSLFVFDQAIRWANQMEKSGPAEPAKRMEAMFIRALGRVPTAEERDSSLTYISQSGPSAWRDFALALYNLKEFIYIQ